MHFLHVSISEDYQLGAMCHRFHFLLLHFALIA